MVIAENIHTAYQSRARAKNWAAWVKDNPVLADLLDEARQLAEETND